MANSINLYLFLTHTEVTSVICDQLQPPVSFEYSDLRFSGKVRETGDGPQFTGSWLEAACFLVLALLWDLL